MTEPTGVYVTVVGPGKHREQHFCREIRTETRANGDIVMALLRREEPTDDCRGVPWIKKAYESCGIDAKRVDPQFNALMEMLQAILNRLNDLDAPGDATH